METHSGLDNRNKKQPSKKSRLNQTLNIKMVQTLTLIMTVS